MRKFYIFIFLFIAAFALQAQAPANYYNNAVGLTGDDLKVALHNIIKGHTEVSYDDLWDAFPSTDNKGNNIVWDMYSDGANYSFSYSVSNDQCGNYTNEGDCFNREHSWPKNWFDGKENSTPGHDLHHIFPTDGYVNSRRSNNPYGEVQTASWTSQNGSKLGTCKSSLGYSGIVFEPIDAYKGDFARAYFYMSVRYYGEDSNWGSSGMTNKSEIEDWAMTMLLRWNDEDPVSQKEIDRNNVIYNTYQHNRNPFIDNPEYARMIWDPNYQDVFTGTFTQYTADIVEGDYIIVYNGHALTNTISSNKLTSTNVTLQDGTITNPLRSIVWHIENISNTSYWTIKNEVVNKYAAGKSDKNQMELLSDVTNYAKWTPTCSNGLFEFENYGRSQQSQNPGNKWLRCNEDNNINAWAPYGTSTGGAVTLYKYMPLEYAYSINGVMGSTTPVAAGSSITLANGANISADYTFAGWTDNLNDIEHNIHEAGESYQINNNVVLYAVYAHEVSGTPVTTYNKVTSAPSNWSGEYLIVCENNHVVLNGALSTLDASNNVITNVTINNGVINPTNNLNAATFTIAKVNNTSFYSIKNQNNKYIGWSSTSSNGLSANNSALSNAISLQSNGNQILIQGTNNNSTITKFLRFNSATSNGNYRFRYYNSNTDNTQNIQLYKKTTITPTVTTYYIQVRELPEGNTEIENITTADIITVPNGSVLTITGTSNTGTTDNLIIENGGQLVVPNNTTVAATVRKTTEASTAKGTNKWYAISSPVNNIAVESVAQGVYNMYYYNEPDNMWMNDKVGDNPSNLTVQFANMTNGRGYLYRSSDSDIEFAGNINSGDVNGDVTIALSFANNNANLKGFNLIGNPFTHNIYKNDVAQDGDNLPAINSNILAAGFYKLKTDGGWDAKYGKDNPIKPGEAVLVKATAAGNLNIANTTNNAASYTPTQKSGCDNIMFAVNSSKYSDVAYAMFIEGVGLNKIEHYNNDIQMLYINQDDEKYAIAMMDDNTKLISLGFKAKTMGQYTLNVKPDGDFSYLHVIDRFTGKDVDMLMEDAYTFIGAPGDNENRFFVRLGYNAGNTIGSGTDEFAYQTGNEIIVEGEGELQIFDMLGRMVTTQYVNGVQSLNVSSMHGVYIFMLIGEDVKTQKIVVK